MVSGLDGKAYVEHPAQILLLVLFCPLCEGGDDKRRLTLYGQYPRWIPVGGCLESGCIYRRYCSRCKMAFSLIPDFILPGRTYGRSLVTAWLWACLGGVASRCEAFYRTWTIRVPARDGHLSWSDLLDQVGQRTHPGYQLLCQWTRQFACRAQGALPSLLGCFVLLRCDFQRDLGEHLTALTRAPERAYTLGIALGLWRAVLEASDPTGQAVSLEAALPSFVDYLAACDPGSHGLRRAILRVPGYDGRTMGGRPPPVPTQTGGR